MSNHEEYVFNLKFDYIFKLSELADTEKEPIPLYPDADGTDLDIFKTLAEINENIEDFINKGRNLFLYSKTTGNGKTAWAKKILINWINKVTPISDLKCRGLYIDVQKFFNLLKRSISENVPYIDRIKQNIEDADLVIWDELGVKNIVPGSWEHEYILSFINSRIDNKKANIYTTNESLDNLKTILGDRIYSRVVTNSKLIEFKGSDKRALNKW